MQGWMFSLEKWKIMPKREQKWQKADKKDLDHRGM